jgi:F420-dependent oxidoreductase-like protein
MARLCYAPMRVCLMIEGQQGVTWPDWLRLADACERLGFEGLFRSDHYFSAQGVSGRGSTDAWTILAALAARTERIRLGTLVSPVTFRAPAVLAKIATTVDEISDGRVEIGLGAGWWAREHLEHGFPFPDDRERFAMLEEQLEVVHRLLTEDRVSFHGERYVLEDATFLPKPVRRPRPPLIVGGRRVGPRMRRLIGRWADEFNTHGGPPEEVADRYARARAGCEEQGRDPDTLVTSLMTWIWTGETERAWRDRVERSDAIDELDPAALDRDYLVGTPERVVQRIGAYADAGVQRLFLNHDLYDDVEMLELIGREILPNV